MNPPASCAELARRLKLDAVPLHGRTYHDMRLAAAILQLLCEEYWYVDCALKIILRDTPELYHAEQEPER